MCLEIVMFIGSVILAFWLVGHAMGLVVMLLVAGLVGFAANAMVPGQPIHGWLGAIGAGLLGSCLGVYLLGHVGPVIASVPLIPALAGSLVVVLVLSLVRRTYY